MLKKYNLLSSLTQSQNIFDYWFFPIHGLIVFLGSIPSELNSGRYICLIGSFAIILMGIVMIFQQKEYKKFNEEKGAVFIYFDLNYQIFTSYCLSLFSSVNQFAVISILAEFKKPSKKRMNKVKFFYLSPSCLSEARFFLWLSILLLPGLDTGLLGLMRLGLFLTAKACRSLMIIYFLLLKLGCLLR